MDLQARWILVSVIIIENSSIDKKNVMKDAITISTISLEAGAKFHEAYHVQLGENKTFKSKIFGQIVDRLQTLLHKKVEYKSTSTYSEAFSECLKNKEPAHLVAIIEGSRPNFPHSFTTLDHHENEYRYDLNEFHLVGNDVRNRNDTKQNMNFYIRQDMINHISVTNAIISVAKIGTFPVAELQFSTQSRAIYGALIVHIPNKFTTTHANCDKTHNAFKKYAKDSSEKRNVILTCYIAILTIKKVFSQIPSLPSEVIKEEILSHPHHLRPKNIPILCNALILPITPVCK